MNKEEFILELKKLGIEITELKLNQLDIYFKLLVSENKKYNLTSIIEEKDIYLKHFYDSLTVIKVIKLNNQSICDIGTGAGFPGLVIKIVFPNISLTLIDATLKKCNFLKLVVEKLELDDVTIINSRIEDYSRNVRQKYDIVISRAVSNLKILLEIGIPLVKVSGLFVALKSNIVNEINNINKYLAKLDIEILKKEEFYLPFEKSLRTIICFKKNSETNLLYPRKYNEIKKREL